MISTFPTTDDVVIRTNDLTRMYGTHTAVDHLDLTVRRGEVYGFLGANGAGKTTTMRMILGLIRPTSGSVDILGAKPGTPESLSRIGAMIETPAFYPHLSGIDNLWVLAKMAGIAPGRISETLDIVGLSGRGGDPFRAYSLGMKQRLGVAAALLKEPDLLILDEPTNGLDPSGMAEMRSLIRRLGDEGHTVMLSSHLMAEIEQVCDRVGIIARGAMVAEGTIDELRGDKALIVQADPLDEAIVLLGTHPAIRDIARTQDAMRITPRPGQTLDAAAINTRLIREGIAVRELRWHRTSLESIFLDLAGERAAEIDLPSPDSLAA